MVAFKKTSSFCCMHLTAYLTEYALHVNSHCLRLISGGGQSTASDPDQAAVADALTASQVHQLRVGCKRLRAMWETLAPALADPTAVEVPLARLRLIHRKLEGSRDRTVLIATFRALAEALERDCKRPKLARALHASAAIVGAGRPASVEVDTLSVLFQAESLAWRELRVPRCDEDQFIAAAFGATYRKARRLGREALVAKAPDPLHRWRRWSKRLVHQLDVLQPCLGAALSERRRRLQKLTDVLGLHQDLWVASAFMRRSGSPSAQLSEKQRKQVRAYLTEERQALLRPLEKLSARAYGQKTRAYVSALRDDLQGAKRDGVVYLPPLAQVREQR